MTIRVGISGFGRVGRAFLRRPSSAMTCRSRPSTTSPTRPLAHPLAFDSTYGRLTAADNELTVAGGADLRAAGRAWGGYLTEVPRRSSRSAPSRRSACWSASIALWLGHENVTTTQIRQ